MRWSQRSTYRTALVLSMRLLSLLRKAAAMEVDHGDCRPIAGDSRSPRPELRYSPAHGRRLHRGRGPWSVEFRSGRRLHGVDRARHGPTDAVREGAGGTNRISHREALPDQRRRVCQWRPDKNPMIATTPPTATNIPMTARVARMSPSIKEIWYNTIHSYRSILDRVKKPLDLRLTLLTPAPLLRGPAAAQTHSRAQRRAGHLSASRWRGGPQYGRDRDHQPPVRRHFCPTDRMRPRAVGADMVLNDLL